MAELKYINVSELLPHPDNPRKDLGDLTELADSIKANGIFQNLTVVPGHHLSVEEWQELAEQYQAAPSEELRCRMNDRKSEDGYTVVIGHRRLAAAKLAGLEQVPCIISELSPNEQLAMMLLENMQRSDLTIYEQAKGFQLMLNMGQTVEVIAQKTGFSQSTIRHRVHLLELDDSKFKKAEKRGATIQDYMALEKLKDPESKNKALDTIGTSNFQYELKKLLDKEQENANREELIKILETFATQVGDPHGLNQVKWISLSRKLNFEKPDDAGKRKYYFNITKYGSIVLYSERDEEEKNRNVAKEKQERLRRERVEQLDKISNRAFELRFNFIKGLASLKKKTVPIYELAIRSMMSDNFIDSPMLFELLGLEFDENAAMEFEAISEQFNALPERMLLLVAYAKSRDDPRQTYHDWEGEHKENETLDTIYDCLEKLGYQMSDEEQAYRDGTHELFTGGACNE